MCKYGFLLWLLTPTLLIADTVGSAVVGRVCDLKDIERLTPRSKRGETYIAANGSGCFVTKDGRVITNCHVIDEAAEVVIVYNSTAYLMRIVKRNKEKDLALLEFAGLPYEINEELDFSKFRRPVYPSVSVRKADVKVGEQVTVVGYPHVNFQGLEAKVTRGIVSSLSGFKGSKDNFQMDAAISGGNSGGPVFDSKGALVGISVAGFTGGENANYAIKTSVLQDFIGDALKLNVVANSTVAGDVVSEMTNCSVIILTYKTGARPHDIETTEVRVGNEVRARTEKAILYARLLRVRKEWKELRELTDGLIRSGLADDGVVKMNEQAREELGEQLIVYAEVDGADVKARIKPICGIKDSFVQCEEVFALDGGGVKRGFPVKAELSYYSPQGALWKGMLDEIYDWHGTKEIRIKLSKVIIREGE